MYKKEYSHRWKVKHDHSKGEVAVAVEVNTVEVAGKLQNHAGNLSILYEVDCFSLLATTVSL